MGKWQKRQGEGNTGVSNRLREMEVRPPGLKFETSMKNNNVDGFGQLLDSIVRYCRDNLELNHR